MIYAAASGVVKLVEKLLALLYLLTEKWEKNHCQARASGRKC